MAVSHHDATPCQQNIEHHISGRNLGTLGDKVNVKPGYGRNFLLPQGKAVRVNAANLAAFEQRRAEYEAKANSHWPMPKHARPSWLTRR